MDTVITIMQDEMNVNRTFVAVTQHPLLRNQPQQPLPSFVKEVLFLLLLLPPP